MPGACPPYGSRFFHFDTQNFHNVAALGSTHPPMRSMPPYRNPVSTTVENQLLKIYLQEGIQDLLVYIENQLLKIRLQEGIQYLLVYIIYYRGNSKFYWTKRITWVVNIRVY